MQRKLCTGQFQNCPSTPPPVQTPGHLTFWKNFGHIPRYVASLDGQMPHLLELQRGSNCLFKWLSVVSPTSRFANRDFANVLGRFANIVVTWCETRIPIFKFEFTFDLLCPRFYIWALRCNIVVPRCEILISIFKVGFAILIFFVRDCTLGF